MINIGDKVRSYDFPVSLVRDWFIEGTIEGILRCGEVHGGFQAPDLDHYILRVERKVVAGNEVEVITPYVYPVIRDPSIPHWHSVEKIDPLEQLARLG